MSSVWTTLAASMTTFAVTNLDDIFLLTVFFARRIPTRRIVAGQYLGFAAIVVVSLAVDWGLTLAVPRMWLRLLGILPVAVGLKELIQIHKSKSATGAQARGSVGVLSIAAITLANGADNIGLVCALFHCQPTACMVGLGSLCVVHSRLVCRREMVWKSHARFAVARTLGPLDCAVCPDWPRQLHHAEHATVTRALN